VLMYLHRYAEAAGCLDRALELSEASGERWNRSELYAMRARASLELGDIDAADTWIGRALATLREYDVTAVSEVYQDLGTIRAAQGRAAEAESSLRRGVDALKATDYNWNKVEPALDLARFLVGHGDARGAAELVETYGRWAHERDIHLWDGHIDEIRTLIAAGST